MPIQLLPLRLMKAYILLFIAILTFACTRSNGPGSNTNGSAKMEYKAPEKLEQPAEYTVEQAKHEKWKQAREDYLKKVNELEKQRLEAIRKCEAERFKKSMAKNSKVAKNSNMDPEEDTLTCEEQNLPTY